MTILFNVSLILLCFHPAAFKVDLSDYKKYQSEVKASEEIERENILETFLDAAAFEELMEDYSQEVKEIYERNIEKALSLK